MSFLPLLHLCSLLSPLYQSGSDVMTAACLDEETVVFSRSGFLVSNTANDRWKIASGKLNRTHVVVSKGFSETGAFDGDANIRWQNGATWYAVPLPIWPPANGWWPSYDYYDGDSYSYEDDWSSWIDQAQADVPLS